MKNIISLIVIIMPFTLASCSNNSDQSSINSNNIEPSAIFNNESNVLIEYYYQNGDYIGENRFSGIIGKNYKIESPKINFMEASSDVVEFSLSSEGYYHKVVYDYSMEPIYEINSQKKFDSFMVDQSKGISFNFIISGDNSSYDIIFENEMFAISNHGLQMKNNDKDAYFGYINAINNNNEENVILSSSENEMFISISFNSDCSIDFYQNGVLSFTYVSTMRPTINDYEENIYIKDLIKNVYSGIDKNGFSIGTGQYIIKELSIGYGLSQEEANILYENNVHTKVKYVDEFGNELFEEKSILDKGGTEYSFKSPILENFIHDKDVVSGITDSSKIEYVKYCFNGNEKITTYMKNKKENILNRYDMYNWANEEWYKISEKLEGDFIVRLNYHLEGAASRMVSTDGSSNCWRTNLTIIHDPNTNDRIVSRLDWYGWMDDVNGDNKHLGSYMDNGSSYLDNYNLDIYNVYNDCDITETINREGDIIKINYIINPNKPGYENRVYHHRIILYGITVNHLNVSFGAEDSIITFNSIKILD